MRPHRNFTVSWSDHPFNYLTGHVYAEFGEQSPEVLVDGTRGSVVPLALTCCRGKYETVTVPLAARAASLVPLGQEAEVAAREAAIAAISVMRIILNESCLLK